MPFDVNATLKKDIDTLFANLDTVEFDVLQKQFIELQQRFTKAGGTNWFIKDYAYKMDLILDKINEYIVKYDNVIYILSERFNPDYLIRYRAKI